MEKAIKTISYYISMYHVVVLTTIISYHLAILIPLVLMKTLIVLILEGSAVLSLLYVCLCHSGYQ